MAGLEDFTPQFADQTESVILERWRGWVNEGLDPIDDAEQWEDSREGLAWWLMNRQAIREAAVTYGLMDDVVASSFPAWSWGEYLDAHAEERGLERLAATKAAGEVRFAAAVPTLVPAGVVVATLPSDSQEGVQFETTISGTTVGTPGFIDLPVRAIVAGSGGKVGSNAITEMVTTIPGVGITASDATVGGSDTENDELLRARVVASFRPKGPGNVTDYVGWVRNRDGVGSVSVVPHGLGAGTVVVILFAPGGGAVTDEVLEGTQDYLDPATWQSETVGVTTLPDATIDVVSTAGVRPNGYVRIDSQVIAYTGTTPTSLTGCTGGTGSVAAGSVISQSGAGRGQAPVGAHVIVLTGTALETDFTAKVRLAAGYSIGGGAGSIDVQAPMEAALAAYLPSVEPGGEVVWAKVLARVVGVAGVDDADDLSIEGGGEGVNLAVPASPPMIPTLGSLTLSLMP